MNTVHETSQGPGVVKVAVVQAAPALFDTPRSLQKLADLTASAARQKAELVVFPEAFIGGYPKGHDFGVRIGIRTPEGRDKYRRYFESAIEVPGPATEFLSLVARDHGVHLVVGVIDRDGGTLYCTALMLGPDGSLLGKRRKLMPTAMERIVWGSGDGSTLPVVPTKLAFGLGARLRGVWASTVRAEEVSAAPSSEGAVFFAACFTARPPGGIIESALLRSCSLGSGST